MIGFILKDLLSLRKYFKTVALFVVFFTVMAQSIDEPVMMPAMVAIVFAMLPVTTFAYDQQSKWDLFAQTLPAARRDIVAGKYGLAVALIVTGTIVSMAMTLVISRIKGTPAMIGDYLRLSGFIVAASILFVSVMLPLIYKFGVEKSRILLFMVIGPIVLVRVAMRKFGIEWSGQISVDVMMLIALVAAVLVMVVSFFISKAIYESRDF